MTAIVTPIKIPRVVIIKGCLIVVVIMVKAIIVVRLAFQLSLDVS